MSYYRHFWRAFAPLRGSRRIGQQLTANEADLSGADGMIPPIRAASKPPAGYVAGGDHIDPFAADNRFSPLRRKIWSNMKPPQRRTKALLARQKAIIAWMSIRRAGLRLPQFVYDETKNAARAAG